MYYSRLKLTVQAPLKLKDLTYKFVVINNNTKKRTQFEGRFDKQGLTGWTEIYNLNTSLIYEVYLRGEILQKISVKPYPDKKTHSVFTIKVTSEITKKVKENIKEIYLEDGVVGWYLVKQKETMLDWSKRIFKKTLIQADFSDLFLQNMKSDPFIFASKESIDSAVNFNSTVNKEVANRYTVLLKKMDEAKQSKNPESFRRNFYLFERANAKEFEALKAASNKRFFSWNHGVNYKDNRDMIRRTVFVRAKNYSSIDDYIKNMDETSKVSKSLKWGGRLVFAWDIYGSVNSVAQVYEKGDSDGTRKEILKQTGKINGGLLGARIGGSIGTAIGGVVIGVVGGTVGLPVLAVVGVIAVGGTLIGGYVGGVTGQAVVEYGYERLK